MTPLNVFFVLLFVFVLGRRHDLHDSGYMDIYNEYESLI